VTAASSPLPPLHGCSLWCKCAYTYRACPRPLHLWHARANCTDAAISHCAVDGKWSSKEAEAAQLRQKRMADAAAADARTAQDQISDLQVLARPPCSNVCAHLAVGICFLARARRLACGDSLHLRRVVAGASAGITGAS